MINYRELGNTGLKVSEISFGTWAIGGSWGKTTDEESLKALDYAMEQSVKVEQNLRALHTPSFTQEEQGRIKTFYDEKVKQHIRGVY